MNRTLRIAVVGTGAIGRIHVEHLVADPDCEVAALCGLDEGASELAARLGIDLVDDYRDLISHAIDGVIVATPNHLHAEMGVFFLEHGVPILVEKPIADTVRKGVALCQAGDLAGVPILVGHHRRHNPLVQMARDVIASEIGRLIGTGTMTAFRKPDSYYDLEWRRGGGAGPLLVNLIHEVDLLRFICDEIVGVQAASRRLSRPWDFDDTAAIVIHYRSGAVGTVFLSESTPAPWSWEGSVSEGMGFHNEGQDYSQVMGTEASLSLPSLTLWKYDDRHPDPGWLAPLQTDRLKPAPVDPYAREIAHFLAVIRGEESSLVDGWDGLRSLAVVEAVIESADSGAVVAVDDVLKKAGA